MSYQSLSRQQILLQSIRQHSLPHKPLVFPSRRSRPARPRIYIQVSAAADAAKVAEVLESDGFKQELSPLRAECEPGSNDGDLRVTVVSKAFEGKTAKRREKLVLKALQQDDVNELTVVAMTPQESAAMLKKWC
ncbi:hypothetical protein CVIRNUC_004149 [Coccomyxa viridis]|uniref:Uncharacterized protein n=1 Tax=Coccomyxa viridis TaxID=1274662 RepID=A0AAV1I0L7_9CHLO|nr:hypothetical protein CVIRNUC_004149 [Coccomyxa viridis]